MATKIIEYRQIIFSEDDLKTALREFDEKQAEHKIKGPIREITIHNGDELFRVELKVDAQIGGRIEKIELNKSQLAAAMLSYCFRIGIPIPKASQKNITQIDGLMTMEIRVNAALPSNS